MAQKGFHPHALREPEMNLSTHPAPIVEPQIVRGTSGQRATAGVLILAAPIDMRADYALAVFFISVKPAKQGGNTEKLCFIHVASPIAG